MKSLSWLSVGVALGAVGYYIYTANRESMGDRNLGFSTGHADLDDAADRATTWGTKQRATGKARKIVGRAKEGLGRVVGDDDLAAGEWPTRSPGQQRTLQVASPTALARRSRI